ncbi:MAG TPA: radical SAM protein [Candidatus Limiplasma sp.]|nr:radical SAM protein [Candidatus Limiplasma sp.]
MKISKQDALTWFTFFASLPEGEELLPWQQEIVFAAFAQIETAVNARNAALRAQIPHLKTLKNRTEYVGDDSRFPQGCRSCLLGTGLSAVRKTNKCNLNCKFCYDYGAFDSLPPIGEGMWEIGGTRFYERDIELLLDVQPKPTGISYVYLEPFMEIEKYYGIIRKFHTAGVHQHLYTNGTLATGENLRALGEAGLDELRFNLGASNCADSVIAAIGTAKRFIPQVGIETPMTPEFFDTFQQKKAAILATGLDYINCAELHLNANNIENYDGEPMYCNRHGYISPIWSRELTLRLMRQAGDESWPIVVHDCSNDTKFARDLNLRAKEGGWFGASGYTGEFDHTPYGAFLPVLADDTFTFLQEEPLPEGYRPGDMFLL